ncbi:MAG: YeeE/YedE thiosulfate transporter family protein [Gammaproteobacteria bacterium]
MAGITVGTCAVAAWYITGVVGKDEFDPVPLQGVTFVSPVAHTVQYVMTYTGATINFGIALVLGMILGSFVYAVLSGNFRIETFRDRGDMLANLTGGVLMGFGGVLGLGCTIGQGVAGMSTLAVGSVIALVAIIFGSVITMKTQYHLLDGKGFLPALQAAFADLL